MDSQYFFHNIIPSLFLTIIVQINIDIFSISYLSSHVVSKYFFHTTHPLSFPDHSRLNKYQNIFTFIFIVSRGLIIFLPHDIMPSFPDHYRLNVLNIYQNIKCIVSRRLTWSHTIHVTPYAYFFQNLLPSFPVHYYRATLNKYENRYTFHIIVSRGLTIFLPHHNPLFSCPLSSR